MEFDEETLAAMRRYCGRDPRVPQKVEVEALDLWGYETWPIDDFLRLVAEAVETVPVDCRETAEFELGGAGGETERIRLRYWRTQTPEEVEVSVYRALQYVRANQAKERATYKALKAKYEQTE